MELTFNAENLSKPWFRALIGVIFILAGFFCLITQNQHSDITRENCIEAEGHLYELRTSSNKYGGARGMWLIFEDYDMSLNIHSSCATDELTSKMLSFKKGTKMKFLHGSEDANIYELWVNDELLLDFDTAKKKIDENIAIGTYIGYVLLPAGVIFAVSAFFKKGKKTYSDTN